MKKLLTIFFLLQFIFGYTQCIEGDCKNGTGTYTWASGDKYVGEWKDGKRHGQGNFTWACYKMSFGICSGFPTSYMHLSF